MKTARFTDLVKKAGAPKTYALWVPPKQDREFQRALKERRLLTINQENVGTKRDYGQVGFVEASNAQFLIFPKSLKSFVDRRIIGINYDLLASEPKSRKAPSSAAAQKKPERPSPKPSTQKHKPAGTSEKRGKSDEEKIVAFQAPAAKTDPDDAPAAKAATQQKSPVPTKMSDAPTRETPRRSAKERKTEPQGDSGVLNAVRLALKDLDSGKTVAAYKRLESLVAEAENGKS